MTPDKPEPFDKAPIIVKEPIAAKGPPGKCPVCFRKGLESELRQLYPGRLACDKCVSEFDVPGRDNVAGLLHDVRKAADQYAHLVPHPSSMDLHIIGLGNLLYDSWFNLVGGRFNAAIILLGTLVESALKECILVHRNIVLRPGTLGKVLAYYEQDARLVDEKFLTFARRLKDEVRNLWQHQALHEITAGHEVVAVSVDIAKETAGGENILDALARVHREIRSGERSMGPMPVAGNKALREIAKQQVDERLAVPLYRDVWAWLDEFSARYLRSKHYEEHRAKFGDAEPAVV